MEKHDRRQRKRREDTETCRLQNNVQCMRHMNLPDDLRRARPGSTSCTRTGSRCRLWLSRRASETTMQALTFTGGAKKAPGWSLSANFLVAHQQPHTSYNYL